MKNYRFELRLHNGSVYAIAEGDSFRHVFRNIIETLFECLRNGTATEVTIVFKNKEQQQLDEETSRNYWKKIL